MTTDENTVLPALREAWYVAMTTPAISSFVEATGVGEVNSGTVVVDPNGPTAYDCPVGGTFTVTGNVADPNTITAGDFINYESSACDSGTGYTVDGDHSIDTAQSSATLPPASSKRRKLWNSPIFGLRRHQLLPR
jgi:hypothetical protein